MDQLHVYMNDMIKPKSHISGYVGNKLVGIVQLVHNKYTQSFMHASNKMLCKLNSNKEPRSYSMQSAITVMQYEYIMSKYSAMKQRASSSVIVLYSRDQKGIGMSHKITSSKINLHTNNREVLVCLKKLSDLPEISSISHYRIFK